MKNFKNIIFMIAAGLTLFSCVKMVNDNDRINVTNSNGEYAILLSKTARTKAEINTISGTDYDNFNLFAWNSVGDTIMKPYAVTADGVGSYSYTGVSGQELQYFKNVASSYNFIGVIPVNANTTLTNGEVKVTSIESCVVDDNRVSGNLDAASPKEFLWAYKSVEKTAYGSTVELPFNHQNAVVYLGFSSDRNDTELLDYTPHVDYQPGNPGRESEVSSKVFDELVAGNTVGWPYAKGTEQSTYSGSSGPYMCYQGSNAATARITNARLAELMPLVNAQFIYTDANGNIDNTDWVKGEEKKNTVFMKFANGVDTDKFLAGNDAFWTNLTESEKTAMQNWYDSGVRVARINQTSDGNYFAWGMMNTQTTIKIITGATPEVPESGFRGIRVFSADTLATYCTHIPHTTVADATISAAGCAVDNRTTSNDVIQFSLPSTTTLSTVPVWSQTTFYAIPGDANFSTLVVKVSYIYNSVTTYDVRVPIKLPKDGLKPGKYYKYELHITSTGNGTSDPDEANNESDEILIEDNPVIAVKLIDNGYTEGDNRIITI